MEVLVPFSFLFAFLSHSFFLSYYPFSSPALSFINGRSSITFETPQRGGLPFVQQGPVTFTEYKAFLLLKKSGGGKKTSKDLQAYFLSQQESYSCLR